MLYAYKTTGSLRRPRGLLGPPKERNDKKLMSRIIYTLNNKFPIFWDSHTSPSALTARTQRQEKGLNIFMKTIDRQTLTVSNTGMGAHTESVLT